jgi:ABC-type lipoprotein release transport system permease subunit
VKFDMAIIGEWIRRLGYLLRRRALEDELRREMVTVTYVSVAAGFLALTIAAGTVPTLRALRIDPARVIRAE